MKTDDAVQYFGSKTLIAQALECSTQAVYAWGDIVPKGSAGELAELSGGQLTLNLDDYPKMKRRDKT